LTSDGHDDISTCSEARQVRFLRPYCARAIVGGNLTAEEPA
jgi:hypothetical protein